MTRPYVQDALVNRTGSLVPAWPRRLVSCPALPYHHTRPAGRGGTAEPRGARNGRVRVGEALREGPAHQPRLRGRKAAADRLDAKVRVDAEPEEKEAVL